MEHKALPIGYEDFGEIISNNFYYVDKTLFIKELLDKKGKANLFTRPRRFGKTLNMSMLRYFFEDTGKEECNAENKKLFDGLEIMSAGEKYLSHMQKYPVISLSLKSAKQPTWELAYESLKESIGNEFQRHNGILSQLQIDTDREKFNRLQKQKGEPGDYITAIAFLSKCLHEAYGKTVIILIDEYDVPLENAYFNGFYQQMIDFIRSLFESALKTNPHLYFAVITGCLRITKESIFTGLNNFDNVSILSKIYDEYFGFTRKDVDELLVNYDLTDKKEIIQKWYDGYLFGKTEIYNPWSIINYVKALTADPNEVPRTYWSNTSSNNIIHALIERADLSDRMEIEDLIAGGTIEKPIHEEITYEDVYQSTDNLWNFLFFTGYLKNSGLRMIGNQIYLALSIPNIEVCQIYKDKILGWFSDKVEQKDLSILYQDILNGNAPGFQAGLTELLQDTISFYDNAEAFYHGFMQGILGHLRNYIVKSNRESGDGRYDMLIRSLDITKPIILLEFKTAKNFPSLKSRAQEALEQIAEKEYDREFKNEGYQRSIRYGIAFYKKNCCIKKEEVIL